MLNALCLTQPGVAQPLVDITILIWSRQDFFATINIIHVKLIQAQKYAIFCLENVTRPMVMKMIQLDLLLHKVQTFPIVIVVIHKCKGKWYCLGFRCLLSAICPGRVVGTENDGRWLNWHALLLSAVMHSPTQKSHIIASKRKAMPVETNNWDNPSDLQEAKWE